MKIGPVIKFFLMIYLLWTHTLSRVSCLKLMLGLWGETKLIFDHHNLAWEFAKCIPSQALTETTKGPSYVVTRNFPNFMEVDMDFRRCLLPCYSNDQMDNKCMGFFLNDQCFTFALTENGGKAFFEILLTGTKIWCAATSFKCTRVNERCCRVPESFIQLIQRGWLTWMGGELLTFYYATPWWFDIWYIFHILSLMRF